MTDGTRIQQPGEWSVRIITLVTLVTAAVLLAAGTAAATPGVDDGAGTGAGPGTTDTASADAPEPAPTTNEPSTSSVTPTATLEVDDDGAECPSAGFTSIQNAVNNASPGDTIEVCPGTYEEKVRIDIPDLRIVGDPGDATPGPGSDAPVMDGNVSKSIAFKLLNDANNVTVEGFEAFNYTANESFTPSGVWTSVNARGATVLDNEFRGMEIAVYNFNFTSTLEDWTIKRTVLVDSTTSILLNQVRDPVIVNNRVRQPTTSGNWGIRWEGPVSGSPSTAVVRDNVVDGTGNSSFSVAGLQSINQFTGSVSTGSRIVNNTVRNLTGGDGIVVENSGGGEFRDLTIARNTVRDLPGSATVLESEVPVEEVRIKLNNFVNTGDFGVENFNTTAGTWVDATNNYWGASDGPSSDASDADAPFQDPVTGTLADGNGSNVTEGGTAGVSNVHFDPFATSPFEFGEDEPRECVNRRNLGRGQTGQECPTDRGISRGESREELDRSTGRYSDTARRDRSRGERGRRSRGRSR